jgi:ABC-type Mn2+/Zn2+ transport system ATPase subunit
MLIRVEQAVFGYARRGVVQVEQLELCPGRCLGIFGPNGVGKSTLVRGLLGLIPPLTGRVQSRCDRLGYLPQHRQFDLHWPMTGFDAAALAISATRRGGWLGGSSANVLQAMRELDVADLSRKRFARLSGGQQQRLLLAGALAADPLVLVLDEPTDGLDVRSRETLLSTLTSVKTRGLCAVMISHEVEDLLQVADDIAWLHWPDEPDQPSRVQLLKPRELAAALT